MLDEAWADSTIYGAMNTKEVLERLIVCDGQKNRGFRKSIFDPKLRECGVATGPHTTHQTMVQLIYASKLLKQGEMPTLHLTNSQTINSMKKSNTVAKLKSYKQGVEVMPKYLKPKKIDKSGPNRQSALQEKFNKINQKYSPGKKSI